MGEDSDGVPDGKADTATRAAHPEPTETRQAMIKERRSAGWRGGFMKSKLGQVGGG
jgi:hypothetical protein